MKLMKYRPWWITFALVLLSLFVLMQIATLRDITLENARLSINGGASEVISLPLKRDIIGEYSVEVSILPAVLASRSVQIIPDDQLLSVSLNGEAISLQEFSPQQLRDYTRGIALKLPQLKTGQENTLVVRVLNNSNPAGLDIRPLPDANITASISVAVALAMMAFALIRHLPISRGQTLLLAVSLIASLVYLSHTSPATRTFDVYEGGGHRDYIEYLIEHKVTPPPGDGWEYHQPPAYYLIGAISKSVLPLASLHGDYWGQLLALWLWTIFLVASLATLRLALRKSTLALMIASLAVCLWPSGIIHSIRIGNDLAIYAFYALAFFYCLRWWRAKATPDLTWACLWASLALLSKSNALAVWGVIGVLLLVRIVHLWLRRQRNVNAVKTIRHYILIPGLIFSLTLVANFGDNVWHYVQGTSNDWLLSNVSDTIHPGLKVANQPANYLLFDLATFIEKPFISTWEDQYGRQYFWNFVWRSALTAEFFFYGKGMETWGLVNGVLLLMMLSGMVMYAIQRNTLLSGKQWKRAFIRNLPWLFALILPFLLLLAYRIKVPLSCNTDFRYIYPVLLPLVFFSCLVWRQFPRFKLAWIPATGMPLIGLSTLVWLALL